MNKKYIKITLWLKVDKDFSFLAFLGALRGFFPHIEVHGSSESKYEPMEHKPEEYSD